MKIEKILSCICVVVILMSVVPVSVFAVDSGTTNVSGKYNSFQDSNEKVSSMQGGQEVKFIGTAIEYHEGSVMPGDLPRWKVSVDEIISGPSELKGHTVFVAIGTATIEPGYMDPNIKSGDIVKVYGIYREVDNVWLEGSNYYLKKVSSECLSISVWTDKSKYNIGETVTIYYQTNTACTAKLTVTKPDGTQVVVGGPNDIPVCTRSKSAAAGYPTGTRTVTFEAWTSDKSKIATCYFDVVEEEKPDLIIQDISWNPYSPQKGDTVTYTVKIKNQGSGSAGSSTVKYYIDGSYVASDSVPSLSAGSTSTQTFTWTAKCGNVQVKAVADATSKVSESNEGNNCRTETVNVACDEKPDLIVASIIFNPNPANKDDEVIVSVTVKNQGTGDAGAHYEFLGYPDRFTILKEWYCSGLKAGASKTFTHTLENVQQSDTYEACADWGQVIQESNENNNCLTGSLEVKKSDEKPDPEITKVEYPTACVNEDEYATISVTVANNGGASNEGYISVSFPNDEDVYVVSGTGNKYNTVYQKDDLIWNSAGVQMNAVDPLVELFDSDWGKYQQEKITMNVKPNSGSDEIVFYVRAALKNDADGDYERDPTYSGDKDQQGWYVKKYSVDVCDYEKVKIRGEIIADQPIISYYSFDVKIDEVLEDPTGNLQEGEMVNVYGHRSGPAQVDDVTVGDEVEVYGEYRGYVGTYEQIFLSEWGDSSSDHYVKKIDGKKVGSLTVTIYPSEVRSEARWKLTTETSWHSSGDTITNIPVGSCTIEFKDASGWTKPSDKTVTLTEGSNSESGWYTQKTGTLTVTIYPSEVQSNGRWKRSTETGWHSSGETITNIPVGSSCTIQFKDVSGWNTPSDKTVTITEGTNSEFGRYKQKIGSLTVTISPSDVRPEALWKLTSELGWHPSGDTIANIPVGYCTIEFKDVSGWTKPSDKTVTITEGPNSESGWYTQKTGTLTVTISPLEVQSNGRWKLITETGWHSSGDTITNIPVGSSCTIQFKDVSGWTKPSEKTVTITEGSNSESGTYTQETGSLKVTLYPSKVRSDARWKLTSGDDTSWHSSGHKISNIPIGPYVIRFNDISDWIKPYDMAITIKEGSNYKYSTYKERTVKNKNLAKAARFRAKTMESIWLCYNAKANNDKLTKEVKGIIDESVVEGFKVFRESIQIDPKSGNPLIDGCIELASLLSICDQAMASKTPYDEMVDIIEDMGKRTVEKVHENGAAQALQNAGIINEDFGGKCDLKYFIEECNKEAEAWEANDMEKVKKALEDEAKRLGGIENKMYHNIALRHYGKNLGIIKEIIGGWPNGDKNKELCQIELLYHECGGEMYVLHDKWLDAVRYGSAQGKCPVNLHAYDSLGRHVGANESGGVDLEIPGAYYSGIYSHPQIIQIFGTTDYYFVIEALAQGEFNLTTESSTYEETTTVQYEHIAIENDTTAIINLSKEGYSMDIDKDGDNNIDYTVDPTTVKTNHPPEVSPMSIADDVIFKDDISIRYTLKDIDNDVCNISARYSTDQMIWHDATMGNGGDGTIGLTSSADGVTHTYVWASGVDLPDVSSVVYFEIMPNDGMADGIRGISNAFYVGEVTASFTYSPSSPSVNENIVFAAYASIGNITNYAWNFDDGTITSTDAPIIMHSYTSAGEYSVILTVTDNEGVTNTISRVVPVASQGGNDFDTGFGSYPSAMRTHTGTITPNQDINVSKLYTYPCAGTGGHTESVRISGNTVDESASWTGYDEDWYNITFDSSFTLESGKTYNYVIITGSYPQIHHTAALQTDYGWLNCTKFTDANGKEYDDWIPAIRLGT